jgi:hypothetical protein
LALGRPYKVESIGWSGHDDVECRGRQVDTEERGRLAEAHDGLVFPQARRVHAALRQPREARDQCGEEPRGHEALPRTEAVAADDERGACRRAQDGVGDWAAAYRPVSRHLDRRGGGQEARKEVGARAGLSRPLEGTQLNAELEVAHEAHHLWEGREGNETPW